MDATTAEVLRAFEKRGCRSIVLKGPALQRELHGDGSRRAYFDTDLLVSPADLPRAARILSELGFALVMDHRDHAGVSEPRAQEWGRTPGRKELDLHWRISGVGVPDERAWEILAAQTEPIVVGGAAGESLSRPGIALHVALHAAHHGTTRPKPLRDLDRALDRIGTDTWVQAAVLAAELDASEAFAAGLRLSPAGERLATELRLLPVQSPRRRLLAATQPPGSLAVLRIVEAPTARARARALRGEIAPAPAFMRAAFPLARRGRVGLALAYLVRAAMRAWQLPGAIRAVRWSRGARPPAGRTP